MQACASDVLMTDTVASSLVGDIYTSVSPYNLCSTDKSVNADVKTHVESAIARYVTDASTQKSLLQGIQSAFVSGCRFTDVYSSKKFIREAVQLARTKPVKVTAEGVQPKKSSISCLLQHTAITGGTISKGFINDQYTLMTYTFNKEPYTQAISQGEIKKATVIKGEATDGVCTEGKWGEQGTEHVTITKTTFNTDKLINVTLANHDGYTNVVLYNVVLKDVTIEKTSVGEMLKTDTRTATEKHLDFLDDQIKQLNSQNRSKKKIIFFKELKQLDYMTLGDGKITTGSPMERINKLGRFHFRENSAKLAHFQGLDSVKEKIDAVRQELNHDNWERDMYWFGGSVMAVPSIKAVTTGVSMHVFPWYARAVQANLAEVDDGLRRISIYFDVAAVSAGTNVNGREYSSPSYGLGLGFDIRQGFILKAGTNFLKSAPVGSTNTSYTFQPTIGVTITREFFQDLLK